MGGDGKSLGQFPDRPLNRYRLIILDPAQDRPADACLKGQFSLTEIALVTETAYSLTNSLAMHATYNPPYRV